MIHRMSLDSFRTRQTISSGGESVALYSLTTLEREFPQVAKLPFSLKILLENLLRREDNAFVKADIAQIASEIPGRIMELGVRDHSSVAAGDVLLRLDPANYRLALAKAAINGSLTGPAIVGPFIGGISQEAKRAVDADTDRVANTFTRDLHGDEADAIEECV